MQTAVSYSPRLVVAGATAGLIRLLLDDHAHECDSGCSGYDKCPNYWQAVAELSHLAFSLLRPAIDAAETDNDAGLLHDAVVYVAAINGLAVLLEIMTDRVPMNRAYAVVEQASYGYGCSAVQLAMHLRDLVTVAAKAKTADADRVR